MKKAIKAYGLLFLTALALGAAHLLLAQPVKMRQAALVWIGAQLSVLTGDPYAVVTLHVDGRSYRYYAQDFVERSLVGEEAERRVRTSAGVWLGSFLALSLGKLGFQWYRARTRERTLRGSSLLSEKSLARAMRREIRARREQGPWIHFGTVPWPRTREGFHAFLVGAPGSGKSTAIGSIIEVARQRGEGGLCYDPSGDMLSKYYREGDIVMAPGDERCMVWDIKGDIDDRTSAMGVVRSLAPPTGQGDGDRWLEMAAMVIADLLLRAKTTEEFVMSMRQPKDWIWEAVKGMPSSVMAGAPMASDSVIFSMNKAVNAVQMMRLYGRPPERIRDWVKDPRGRWVWCFLRPSDEAATRPLIAAFIETAALHIISLPPELRAQRRWIIVDEWPSLGKMMIVPRAVYEGRKFGAGVVLAAQSLPQIDARYGKEEGSAIVAACATHVVFRCPPGEAAEAAEKMIGRPEVVRSSRSVSLGEDGRSRSIQEQYTNTAYVSAVELAEFPDLHAVLRVAPIGIGRVRTRVWSAPRVCPVWVDGDKAHYVPETVQLLPPPQTPEEARATVGGTFA